MALRLRPGTRAPEAAGQRVLFSIPFVLVMILASVGSPGRGFLFYKTFCLKEMRKKIIKPETNIVKYGAGVNSCAMICLLVKNGVGIDWILFSDTLAEKPDTYAHLDIMDKWLNSVGYPKITRLPPFHEKGLFQECFEAGRLPAIAYGFKSCSDKWKRRPFKKWVKAHKLYPARTYVGYDIDEEYRAKDFGIKKEINVYPLIEAGMDRLDCVKLIIDTGLPVPPKSACFFCPSTRKRDVELLRENNPDLFKKAVELEQNALKRGGANYGLGRQFEWKNAGLQTQIVFESKKGIEMGCDCSIQ